MNIIKSLIIKDILQLKSYKKNFLLSIFIYCILILTNSKNSNMPAIGAAMITFLFSTYALATFNYDEKSKSDRYILTMPLNKKDVILSKYILSISSILVGSVIGAVISIFIPYISNNMLSNYKEIYSTIIGSIYGISLVQCIQIPCIYKYGAEKGRTQIYLVFMLVFLLLGIFYYAIPNINIDLEILNIINPIVIISLIIIINYYISYKISCKIYQKKEV